MRGLSRVHRLVESEIRQFREQSAVYILYRKGKAPEVQVEEGSVMKRLLRCKDQYPDATHFRVGGLRFTHHRDRAEFAENVRKILC